MIKPLGRAPISVPRRAESTEALGRATRTEEATRVYLLGQKGQELFLLDCSHTLMHCNQKTKTKHRRDYVPLAAYHSAFWTRAERRTEIHTRLFVQRMRAVCVVLGSGFYEVLTH